MWVEEDDDVKGYLGVKRSNVIWGHVHNFWQKNNRFCWSCSHFFISPSISFKLRRNDHWVIYRMCKSIFLVNGIYFLLSRNGPSSWSFEQKWPVLPWSSAQVCCCIAFQNGFPWNYSIYNIHSSGSNLYACMLLQFIYRTEEKPCQ